MNRNEKGQFFPGCEGIRKGEKASPETRLKQSLAKRGKAPPNKGKKMSEDQKRKISISKAGKSFHTDEWKANMSKLFSDDGHPNWKGDKVGYAGIHSWITRKMGKAKVCEQCGTYVAKKFHWHNKSNEYKRELSDWKSLCAKCHANAHKNWEKRQYAKRAV